MIKITKFGGSSVADAEQFRKVKSIIEADPSRRFVVISAAGKRHKKDNKITDLLYLCHSHVLYHVDPSPLLKTITDRFFEIKESLGLSTPIEEEIAEFGKKLPDMSVDEIVSRGEYFTSRLMADFLGFPFVDAKDVIAMHFDGSFDYETTQKNLIAVMQKVDRFVMPGFYGSYPDGEVKVMSRGGSDISGSMLARCLNADLYENWTDVSGFLMTDPRIVPEAKNIQKITFSELRELSYMGASVLHEEAVFPLREQNIPLQVLNTNRPNDPGTIVLDSIEPDPADPLVTGIAGKKNFVAIEISKKHMSNSVGFIRKVLEILEQYKVSVEHLPSGIDSFSVVVNQADVANNIHEIIARIKDKTGADLVRLTEPFALIAIVGRNMMARSGTSGRLFNALGQSGINIRMISQGSAELNIIVGVDNSDFERAVTCLYQTFAAL
ncbi:MAG: aspartate kinase [Sutterella wadsworthensis]|jgi:aspartate kinase|nr:aspartate kinase [Sutterella wadsworthensis]